MPVGGPSAPRAEAAPEAAPRPSKASPILLRILIQSLKIASIAIAAGLILLAGFRFFDNYREQALAEDNVGRFVVVTIEKDDAGDPDRVAARLKDANLIKSEVYFTTRLRFMNKDIQPGSYRLRIGDSVPTIIGYISTEKSEARTENKELTLTVPEGWRTEQIAEELDKLGLNVGAEGFMEAVRSYDGSQFDFLKDRPDPRSLEGYLFPDTYRFKADTPPEDIIQQMLQNFEAKFDETLRERAAERGLTIPEVLALASLVEREAQVEQERPVIAGVYLNRINLDMNLESDPTVQYAIGKKGEWWPKPTEDDLFVEDDYNTYQNGGLPPGPICNPGLTSILGVLDSVETDYIFFVASPAEDGTHFFAVDNASQDQNINYLRGNADAPAPCSVPFVEDCGYVRPVE